MRPAARHARFRAVVAVTTGAALLALTGMSTAFAGDEPTPTPSATSTALPVGVSEATRTAVLDAQQQLAKLTRQAARTRAAYVAATARLSQARHLAAVAARDAAAAAERVATSSRQLGQLAANSYRAGPMAGAEAVLGSSTPFQLLHTASVIRVVADHQTEVLRELRDARSMAADAAARAQTAKLQAAKAVRSAQHLKRVARRQVAAAVVLLTELRAKAVTEAQAAEAKRLTALASTWNADLSAVPLAATTPGPPPGLPAAAGADPGDGLQSPVDHLRPRAERTRALITALFGVTDIGGWRPSDAISSDHPMGRALDVMMSGPDMGPADPAHVVLGWQVARWAQANAVGLGVTYVIWQARIWSVARAGEGWRDYTTNFPYGSQVDPTTLHLNHVHISFG